MSCEHMFIENNNRKNPEGGWGGDYKLWDDKLAFQTQQLIQIKKETLDFTGPFIARLMTEGKPSTM